MLRTIVIGSCVMVQGIFIRSMNGGLIEVRVGKKIFSGMPVIKKAA